MKKLVYILVLVMALAVVGSISSCSERLCSAYGSNHR